LGKFDRNSGTGFVKQNKLSQSHEQFYRSVSLNVEREKVLSWFDFIPLVIEAISEFSEWLFSISTKKKKLLSEHIYSFT